MSTLNISSTPSTNSAVVVNNRRALKLGFIPRVILPVFVKKVHKDFSCQSEKAGIRREMDFLFADFSADPKVLSARKKGEALRKQRLAAKRAAMFRTTTDLSYVAIAEKSAKSEGLKYSSLPTPSVGILSRSQARESDSAFYAHYKQERAVFKTLALAIAQRYARKVTFEVSQRRFVTPRQKRVLQNKRNVVKRFLRRHPAKEVEEFDWDAYLVPAEVEEEVISSSIEVRRKPTPTSVKQIKVRRVIPCPETDRTGINYPVVYESNRRTRFLEMAKALSKTQLARELFLTLMGKRFGVDTTIFDSLVEPQMDPEPKIGSTSVSADVKGSVVIEEKSIVDTGVAHASTSGFQSYAVSTESQVYTSMTDRWIMLDTIDWSVSNIAGSLIWDKVLPYDILASNRNSPNVQLFLTHRFFRFTSMKLKFVLNSNPFQVGQLMCSWIYGDPTQIDQGFELNVYSASQRNNCLLNAGCSNSGELTIPYRHFHTMMSNKDCRLGRVSIVVLNPLAVAASVAPTCRITMFASFEGAEFFGMISRSIGDHDLKLSPQMDSIGNIMNATGGVLSIIGREMNRDNPPVPLQPVSFVPQSMPSFAHMDGCGEPLNVLRADPRGQTPHCSFDDEMSISALLQGWGLFRTITWMSNQPHDRTLLQLPVEPLMSFDRYPTVGTLDTLSVNAFPPLAVISSMFGLWRGDIQYMFRIVASKFYTGRLMVAFVPLGEMSKNYMIDELKYSPYQVYDILDSTEIVFNVPWYWYNAWARTRSYSSHHISQFTGCVVMKVVNPLIGIDSVPPNVNINIYMRAGKNFEVSIPRLPALAPAGSDHIIPPKSQFLQPYNMECKWYTTWERNLQSKLGKYALTVYISSVTDAWVGYLNAQKGAYYKLQDKTSKGFTFRCGMQQTVANKEGTLYIHYGVFDPALSTSNAKGLVVFEKETLAIAYAQIVAKGGDVPAARDSYAPLWVADGSWSEVQEMGQWVQAENDTHGLPLWEIKSLTSVLSPQMDRGESAPIWSLDQPAQSTSMGLSTFGESIQDLKSLCRRFNHFCSLKGKTCNTAHPRDCAYFAKIVCHPFRKIDPKVSYSFDNRAREGVISTVSSGYYGWRGGLRLRFCVVGIPPAGGTIYIQHRFDENNSGKDDLVTYGGKVVDVADMMSTQYATYVQSLDVNSVSSVEIPYYQQNEFLVLTPTRRSDCYANGSIYVWVHSIEPVDIKIEVYYSLADDCRFSVFQGFPGMISLAEIGPEPQMDVAPQAPSFLSRFNPLASTQDSVKLVSENIDDLAKELKKTTGKMNKVLDWLTGAVSAVGSEENKKNWTTTVREGSSPLTLMSCFMGSIVGKIFDIFTHVFYAILSPSPATIGWAIVNIYYQIWGFSFDILKSISTIVSSLWDSLTSPIEPPLEGKPKPNMDISEVGQYASLLFVSLATFCKVKADPPKDWASIGKGLFVMGTAVRYSSYITTFFKDNLELVRRVWIKFLEKFGKKCPNYDLIVGEKDKRLQTWIVESSAILNPAIEDKILLDAKWAQKVFELAIVGRGIQVALVQETYLCSPSLLRVVTDQLKGLKVLEKKLVDRKMFSSARYEPYSLWVAGKAGTGKSRFINDIMPKLAKSQGYETSHAYHAITAGQKYFDGFRGQPCILLDDFLCLTMASDAELFAQFLQMKSAVIFNPPYAIAEDKDRLVNFPNLCVTSNFTHVDNMPGIHDCSAYNRRRNLVLLMEFRPDVKNQSDLNSQYTQAQLDNLDHVDFYRITNILSAVNPQPELISRVENETYNTTIWKVIKSSSDAYHARERVSYYERCKVTLDTIETINDSGIDLDQYLTKVAVSYNIERKDYFGNATALFDGWFSKVKEGASFVAPLHPEGQMDPTPIVIPNIPVHRDFLYPWHQVLVDNECYEFNVMENQPSTEGKIVEPLKRHGTYKLRSNCAHECLKMDNVFYDTHFDFFYRFDPHGRAKTSSVSCSGSVCQSWDGTKFVYSKDCILLDVNKRVKFFEALAVLYMQFNPQSVELYKTTKKWESLPNCHVGMCSIFADQAEKVYLATLPKVRVPPVVRVQQVNLKDGFELVDNVVISKQSRFKTIPQYIWKTLVALFKLVAVILANVALFVAGMLGIFGLVKLYKYGKSKFCGSPEGNLHPSGDYKTMKNVTSLKTRALSVVKRAGPNATDQEIISRVPGGLDGLKTKIIKNVFNMVGLLEKNDICHEIPVRCIGLRNKKFLVLKHYIEHFEAMGISKVAIVFRGYEGVVTYNLKDIVFEWTEEGYGIGEFPKSFPRMFGDIVNYMPSETFDGSYPTNLIILEVFQEEVVEHSVSSYRLEKPLLIPQSNTTTAWTISQGFEYGFAGKGKCGSLVLAPGMSTPLVGVHTSGIGNRKGFGELLFRETFNDDEDDIIEYQEPNMSIRPNTYRLDGEYLVEGSLDNDLRIGGSTKTKILPSIIHGVFPVGTSPAPLTADDPRLEEPLDPFHIGVSKRCKKSEEFNPVHLEIAGKDLLRFLDTRVLPVRHPGVLSVSEAIEGLSLKGYEGIEMSTSEGFPWSKLRPKGVNDKSWLFDACRLPNGRLKVNGIFAPLMETLLEKSKLRNKGIVPTTYFSACLKDARILKSKIPIPGKTRIFEISPVELTISQRQYFLDFIVAYQSARMNAENTIGINPDGDEWTELAVRLTDFSPFILTADYSGYGPGLNHAVLEKSFDITRDWYGKFISDPNQRAICNRVRNVIKHEVSHGLHVAKDLVFRPVAGLPSGNCETVEKNSVCNSLYVRLAYLGLAEKFAPHYADMYWFFRFVLLFHNGDDLIISVKGDIIDWFNNVTLIDFFRDYNIKMTDSTKSGVVVPYCSIEQASYLKRGFVKHPTREGQWLAPLDEVSIKDTANWIWRCINEESASLVNSEMCARLAYTRGPEFYNDVVTTLQNSWQRENKVFRAPSWKSLDMHIWEGTPGPSFQFL